MNKYIQITLSNKLKNGTGFIKDITTIKGEHIPATFAQISSDPKDIDTLTLVIPMHAVDIVWEIGEYGNE